MVKSPQNRIKIKYREVYKNTVLSKSFINWTQVVAGTVLTEVILCISSRKLLILLHCSLLRIDFFLQPLKKIAPLKRLPNRLSPQKTAIWKGSTSEFKISWFTFPKCIIRYCQTSSFPWSLQRKYVLNFLLTGPYFHFDLHCHQLFLCVWQCRDLNHPFWTGFTLPGTYDKACDVST